MQNELPEAAPRKPDFFDGLAKAFVDEQRFGTPYSISREQAEERIAQQFRLVAADAYDRAAGVFVEYADAAVAMITLQGIAEKIRAGEDASVPFNDGGFDKMRALVRELPLTWKPAILLDVVEACYKAEKKTFKPGGASRSIARWEEQNGYAEKKET